LVFLIHTELRCTHGQPHISRVKVWKFSSVSGTDSVPIIRETHSVPENSKNTDTLTRLWAENILLNKSY